MKHSTHIFTDIHNAPFDVLKYSKMKFGSDNVAKEFAYEMANRFYVEYYNILITNKIVIIPAPSTTVPVAATLLSLHFMNRINSLLIRKKHQPVEWTLIHRNMTYNNNYADLPKEERQKLLANDSIYLNKDFVKDKFLVFIDDCTITGTHEEKVESYLKEENLDNKFIFVSYAKYNGDDPSVEMRLNHTLIKDAMDLAILSNEDNHTVTTRSLRLFLEYPEDKFQSMMDICHPRFLEETYYGCIIKGYHDHKPYSKNFSQLQKRVMPDVFLLSDDTMSTQLMALS